jgi:hypothetical protein
MSKKRYDDLSKLESVRLLESRDRKDATRQLEWVKTLPRDATTVQIEAVPQILARRFGMRI